MELTRETLAAADLADTWIDTILSDKPEALLGAGGNPAAMAKNLADFRQALVTALAEQPLPALYADDDDDDYDYADEDDEDALESDR